MAGVADARDPPTVHFSRGRHYPLPIFSTHCISRMSIVACIIASECASLHRSLQRLSLADHMCVHICVCVCVAGEGSVSSLVFPKSRAGARSGCLPAPSVTCCHVFWEQRHQAIGQVNRTDANPPKLRAVHSFSRKKEHLWGAF